MNDAWLPRIICGGLIAIALACIATSAYNGTTAATVTTLLVIASNVVSGLLGYVAQPNKTKES
jgi:membrane associated rhomboid family serine protease